MPNLRACFFSAPRHPPCRAPAPGQVPAPPGAAGQADQAALLILRQRQQRQRGFDRGRRPGGRILVLRAVDRPPLRGQDALHPRINRPPGGGGAERAEAGGDTEEPGHIGAGEDARQQRLPGVQGESFLWFFFVTEAIWPLYRPLWPL